MYRNLEKNLLESLLTCNNVSSMLIWKQLFILQQLDFNSVPQTTDLDLFGKNIVKTRIAFL